MSSNNPARIYAKAHGFRTTLPGGARRLCGGWDEEPDLVRTEYVRADIATASESVAWDKCEERRLQAAALLEALKALLPEVDSEIEQRQTSGNDEYWQGLKALSDAAHAAVRKAEGK